MEGITGTPIFYLPGLRWKSPNVKGLQQIYICIHILFYFLYLFLFFALFVSCILQYNWKNNSFMVFCWLVVHLRSDTRGVKKRERLSAMTLGLDVVSSVCATGWVVMKRLMSL